MRFCDIKIFDPHDLSLSTSTSKAKCSHATPARCARSICLKIKCLRTFALRALVICLVLKAPGSAALMAARGACAPMLWSLFFAREAGAAEGKRAGS